MSFQINYELKITKYLFSVANYVTIQDSTLELIALYKNKNTKENYKNFVNSVFSFVLIYILIFSIKTNSVRLKILEL